MAGNGVSRAVRAVSVAVLVLWLAACDQPPDSDTTRAKQEARVVPGSPQALFAAAPAAVPMREGVADLAAQRKRLAVSHMYRLRLPSGEVERVQRAHIEACVKLGCDILSSRLDRSDSGSVNAATSVRVAPDKLADFTAAMTESPVEVVSHVETAEDKTLPLLDIEKRLESKLALRDRLAALLKDNVRKTAADLIAIEKEIAQVQGDIESATSQRDYLLTITDTVKIDIYYTGTIAQAGGLDLSPIHRAVNGIGRTVVASIATLISFAASALVWIPVALIAAWVLRLIWRGARRPARA